MEKVTSYFVIPANFNPSAAPSHVRGHHSSINKAVNAHRQMVEERTNRQAFRQLDASAPSVSFVNNDVQVNGTKDNSEVSADGDYVQNEMIDTASGPAKLAMVQAFQTTEPGRPVLGEPVPKGTYLDVEG